MSRPGLGSGDRARAPGSRGSFPGGAATQRDPWNVASVAMDVKKHRRKT